mgnify:CR=1 FL=1
MTINFSLRPPAIEARRLMIGDMARALVDIGADLTSDERCVLALMDCRFRGADIQAFLDDAMRHALALTVVTVDLRNVITDDDFHGSLS